MTVDELGSPGPIPVRRVLVVDDAPDINLLVQVRLRGRGFTIGSAADGEEALARIDEEPPDLMFLDVSMPGMSGLEVLERVRGQGMDLAVIMMTAFGSEQVAVEALRHGANDYLRKPFEPDEFATVLNRTVERLELMRRNAWLQEQLDQKRRQLEAELERAARVQADLLPHETPILPGFDLAAVCYPAHEVGGDFFDWLEIGQNRVAVTLADVMGKGMPAALLMATVRAVLRTGALDNPPAAAIEAAVRAIEGDLQTSGSFVTLFHAQIDPNSRSLSYVDAGHGYAFVRRAGGELEHLQVGGLPLGALPGQTYDQGCITLEDGDVCLVCSDGVFEANLDQALDVPAIAQTLAGASTAAEMASRVVRLVGPMNDLRDDVTVLVVRCLQSKLP